MAHFKVKLESNGTGKTRRDGRAVYKAASKRVRRQTEKRECRLAKKECWK